MGLLTTGVPLEWDEIVPYSKLIKERGIQQFISLYKRNSSRKNDVLTWGDEIEYFVVKMNHFKKQAYLSTISHELLPVLQQEEEEGLKSGSNFDTCWRSEFAKFMLEGTPGGPYSGQLNGLLQVEKNMRTRRIRVLSELEENQTVLTVSNFFSLGSDNVKHLDIDSSLDNNVYTQSSYLPDKMIHPHPRYASLSKNLRLRKGSKATFQLPIYRDINTPKALLFSQDQSALELDTVGFAASCCCLQVTFQLPSFEAATFAYDAFIPIAPIFLALTANTPMMKGYLANMDTRFNYLKNLIDCRRSDEQDQKSRYDSCSLYIGENSYFNQQFNDINLQQDSELKETLQKAKIPENVSHHLATIFNNDPLIIFEENITEFDPTDNSHFENIQSTVWQTVRFKPPTPDAKIGWRVEFRPMEVQLTDFENAAFAVFINLLLRAILKFRPNFYMPISKVDENIDLACKRDAIKTEVFMFPNNNGKLAKFNINRIMNGGNNIEGLIPLVQRYLKEEDIEMSLNTKLQSYINFISDRSKGKLMSGANFLRQMVLNHPDYLKDSKLNDTINYDLIQMIDKLGKGYYNLAPQLLGKYHKASN
ncbi:GCS-domain-containing protein [Neoconidiobolus thromboides FSU 785]|nr:GCS-domain-containing protein [Neoconidiobolus thromboides FSU 785]